MAVWRDPLDELIDELERVLPPPPLPRDASKAFLAWQQELQARAAALAFGPHALDDPDEPDDHR